MKKQFILAFWVLASLYIQAQEITWNTRIIHYAAPSTNLSLRDRQEVENMPSEIEHEKFFKDSTFRMGELRTRKKLFTTELVYRFDQINRVMEVKMESGKQMYLFEKDILYCKVFYEGDTAVFMPVIVPDTKKLTLVHVVYKTPTLQLYRDIHKTFSRRIVSYTNREVYDEINNDYKYFIRKNNKDPLVEVKITAKSLSEVMPEKRNRIVSLFKGKENLTVSQVVHIMAKLDSPSVVQ